MGVEGVDSRWAVEEGRMQEHHGEETAAVEPRPQHNTADSIGRRLRSHLNKVSIPQH